MSTSKNPFEIRLDLLYMAKDYQERIYNETLTFARDAQATLASQFKDAGYNPEAVLEQFQKLIPVPYKIEDILKTAEKFAEFVNGPTSKTSK